MELDDRQGAGLGSVTKPPRWRLGRIFVGTNLDVVTLSALVIAVLLRQFLHYVVFKFYADDAYIFMRYANNFADGHGLVYNIHERVLGFTSTVFVLILSILSLLRQLISLENATNLANTLLFVVASLSINSLAPRDRSWKLLLLAFWFFYLPWIDGSVNGMETMLFIALQYSAIWAFTRMRLNLGLVLLVLGALSRPEGALFLVAGAIALWRTHPRKYPVLGAIVGAVIAGVWVFIAMQYYGSPIPQSMLAKSTLVTGEKVWGSGTSAFDKAILMAVGISSDQYSSFSLRVVLALRAAFMAALALFSFGTVRLFRQRSCALAIPLFFALNWLFYVVGRPVRIWSWYTVPTSVAFVWTLVYGASELFESRVAFRRLQLPLVCVAILALVFSLPYGVRKRKQALMAMTSELIRVTNWVSRSCSNANSVMIGDIGQVGFRLPRARIIDPNGLVSPKRVFTDSSGTRYPIAHVITTEQPSVVCLLGEGDPSVDALPGYRKVSSVTPRYTIYARSSCRPPH